MRKHGQPDKYAPCECGTPWFPHRRGYCRSGAGERFMLVKAFGPPPELVVPVLADDDPFAFFEALASKREAG